MLDTLKRRARDEQGFTLIELLVVITILGILAAVVVFSVGGVGDRGDESACKTDYATIQTAEEAYFARNGMYASEALLATAPNKYLSTQSKLHDITVTDSSSDPDSDPDEYTINTNGSGANPPTAKAACHDYLPAP